MINSKLSELQNEEASIFLNSIFLELDKAEIPYCVERNYEKYPYTITGDVDLIVRECDIKKASYFTCNVAKINGWNVFIKYETHQAAHFGFYSNCYPNRFVLVIELFAGGVWRGFKFLNDTRVIQMKERYRDLWKPHSSHQAMITLIHHLLYNGKVFEKYRDMIYSLYKNDTITFINEIAKVFGKNTSKKLGLLVGNRQWEKMELISNKLRFKLIQNSLIYSTKKTMKDLFFIFKDLKNKPKGLLIIFENGDSDSDFFAKNIIDIAIAWHIYIPPMRKIINFSNKGTKKKISLVSKILKNGGVVVVMFDESCKKKDLIQSKIENMYLNIKIVKLNMDTILCDNGKEYLINYIDNNAKSIMFWNLVLNNLTQR